MNTTLTSSKDRIAFLLEHYPSLREDDKKLWASYLVLFHNLQEVLTRPDPFDSLCNLLLKENVCSGETLRRLRQKIQESGLYRKESIQHGLHTPSTKCKTLEDQKIIRTFNVASRVEHLLRNYDALRDNDTQLWLAYLVMFHNAKERINNSIDPYTEFCDIIFDKDVPTMQSIRRSRQVLQEKGLYLGEKRKKLYAKENDKHVCGGN